MLAFNRNLQSGNPSLNSFLLSIFVTLQYERNNMNMTVFLLFRRVKPISFSCGAFIATVSKKRVIDFKLINSENFQWVK